MSDYNIEKQGDIYRIKGTRVALDSIILLKDCWQVSMVAFSIIRSFAPCP
jgi:hypothetical protein